MTLKLQEIVDALADKFDARFVGDGQTPIGRLAPLDVAGHHELSFLSHPKYLHKLASSNAACVVVSPAAEAEAAKRGAYIVVDEPYVYFAHITQLWKLRHSAKASGALIHPTAFIDPTAEVAATARIGAFAVVGTGAVVARGAQISEHCVLGDGASVGANTLLSPRVTVMAGCTIGQRCIVHSGAVIGADGFGFAPHNGQWVKIEQLGAVRVGDDVEIGSNTCIDRGALDDTVIEDGVKLDNLIQIGHNVRIGKHTALAGCVGVAGSAVIGAHCTVGGGAVIFAT